METINIGEVRVLQDKTEQRWAVATAYRVADRRFLTVAHVLYPDRKRVDSRPKDLEIQIRPNVKNEPWKDAVVVWNGWDLAVVNQDAAASDGSVSFDACIIELAEGVQDTPEQGRLPRLHDGNFTWGKFEAQAYPKAVRDEAWGRGHEIRAELLSGKCSPFDERARGSDVILVKCEGLVLKDDHDWSGASGFAVFVDGAIAAIATEFDPTRTPPTILALPMPRLMRLSSFRNSLGGISAEEFEQKQREWSVRIARKLSSTFSQLHTPEVAELFKEVFGEELASDRQELRVQMERLAKRSGIAGTVRRLSDLCADGKLLEQAKILDTLSDHLIPLSFDPTERCRFWNELRSRSAVFVEAAVTCEAAAEFRMAGVDREKANFRADGDPALHTRWRGQSAVSFDFENVKPGGIEPEHIATRILIELSDILPSDVRPFTYETRQEIMSGKLSREFKPESESRVQLCKNLTKMLQTTKEINNRSTYCVFRVPAEVPRSSFFDAIRKLRSWIPDLDFLEISRHSPHAEHEVPALSLFEKSLQDRQR